MRKRLPCIERALACENASSGLDCRFVRKVFDCILVTRGFQLRDRATANRGTDTRSRRTINVQGYILVRINGRRRLEHRVVMEAIIGRPLLRGDEVVHHLNHDKAD